jgi:hypothetical protein
MRISFVECAALGETSHGTTGRHTVLTDSTLWRLASAGSSPPADPQASGVVLMADAQGRVDYYDDGGAVDLKDVIRRHCEQKQRAA